MVHDTKLETQSSVVDGQYCGINWGPLAAKFKRFAGQRDPKSEQLGRPSPSWCWGWGRCPRNRSV